MAKGVVAAFDGDEIYDFVQARDWFDRRCPEMAFTPEQIVAASAPKLELDGPYDSSGVYFLLREGRVCYIGKAKELHGRIRQHRSQGRPFDAVAVIAGVHWEFIGALESAYVTAWEPPWNAAPVYAYHTAATALAEDLTAMDRALVCTLPEYGFAPGEVEALADRLG